MKTLGPLLDVHVKHRAFGANTVLADVNVEVEAGEVIAVVGPSGCGKSTLLRILAGLDHAYVGHVTLDGERVRSPNTGFGFVFQEPRLLPWLSVEQNVIFPLLRDTANHSRARALLDEVGLSAFANVLPKTLSGGQAQRVALARALYREPKVLLLDEPFSALDAITRAKLQDLLADVVRHHGTTVVLVTHDIDEAFKLANRVVLLGSAPAHGLSVYDVREARGDGAAQRYAALKTRVLAALEGEPAATARTARDNMTLFAHHGRRSTPRAASASQERLSG